MKQHKIGLGIAFAVGLGIAAPALAQQAVQWRVEDGGNGHWYGAAIYPEPGMNWVAARADVQARGADLVSLETADERTFATGVWAASTLFGAWIGLYQAADACEPGCGWRWVSGAPLADSDWAAGEPNNEGGSYGDEDHAMLAGLGWGGGPGRWVDWPGATILKTRAALVEWSADCNGDGIVDYGQILDGTFEDTNSNGVPDCCDAGQSCIPCPSDITGGGVTDAIDLAAVLGAWGTSGQGKFDADVNDDGTVDAGDLSIVLAGWGPCPN